MMRAMQVVELGQPLQMNEVDTPKPEVGEVLVRIHTCGLNFGDLLVIKGTYQEKPALPATIGMEICGTITALGAGVTHFKVGQKIGSYCGFGGLSDFAAIRANLCVPLPDDMNPVDAAAFLIAYGTSHVALDYKAHLKAGDRLLVFGCFGWCWSDSGRIGKTDGCRSHRLCARDRKVGNLQTGRGRPSDQFRHRRYSRDRKILGWG